MWTQKWFGLTFLGGKGREAGESKSGKQQRDSFSYATLLLIGTCNPIVSRFKGDGRWAESTQVELFRVQVMC